jgi:hypothetical protein
MENTNTNDTVNTVNTTDNIQTNEIINITNEIYNHITSIHQDKITAINIVAITSELIQLVEKYKNLTGMQKKNLVINIIKKIINNGSYTDEEKVILNVIVQNTLPTIIDGFIDAINGLFNFTKNNVKYNKLLCCFTSNK